MKTVQDLKVVGYDRLNDLNYILELQSRHPLPEIRSGNFAEIKIDNNAGVFLRRPFSILDVDYSRNTLRFFVKIIGEGTRSLGELQKNDTVNLIFPLGNSFTLPGKGHVLIVAGGSGIAPFLLLSRELNEKNIKTTILLGGKTRGDIFLANELGQYGDVLVTTEDGSMGEKGLATEHSIFGDFPEDVSHIYTCGPEPMMKAVAVIARTRNIPCEVSLENTMACGFGACLCCVVETTGGNKCVCTEGPVFNINELTW